mmetsp:Transcript_26800/g.31175  ORF Transcript_26800/g.31175 Transcript_26800/m.31175 type:complete len:490 (+) Transcript_26800:324-1793(+)
MQRYSTPKLKVKDAKFPSVVAGVFFLGSGSSINLKRFIKPFQPLAEKTPEGNKLRRENFKICDGNGSGYCSLSDVETFILTKLQGSYGEEKGFLLFRMYRPSYIRAFSASKVIAKSANTNDNDYVTFNEFRVLSAYICIFGAMLDVFSKVDGGGKGQIDVDDDRRIDKEEWVNGYSKVHDCGFSGLDMITAESLALIAFDQMDSDAKGMVLFKEFCVYIKDSEMTCRTDLGKLLSGQVPTIAPKANPNKINTSRSALTAGSSASSRPIVVAGAYQPGQSCSQELKDLLRVFAPLAEKTLVGKKDRQKNFVYADPNGNGYASLAELDSFVKQAFLGAFPRNKAKELFLRFRKCYQLAYNCSKLLHSEGGAVDDDYVTFAEFRLFNAYICIYSGMLDAYCRMDESEDKKIDLSEFMKAYNHMRDYGFVALSSIENPDEAMSRFNEMDVDGSGHISFREWCTYITKTEGDADTEIGKMLSIGGLEGAGSWEY